MKLEKQVCSLKSAKRLKELGVNQESYFYYFETKKSSIQIVPTNQPCHEEDWGEGGYLERFSAYTVAELGEMLPKAISVEGKVWIMDTRPDYMANWESEQRWVFGYKLDGLLNHYESSKTEADARAGMLIYLLENKIIDL